MQDINDIVAITKPRKAEEKGTYLFYGMPGTGKTSLAGSASLVESMGKVLLVDFEGGSSVLSLKYPDVDVALVESWSQTEDLIFYLLDEEHDYKTVILDTAGEAQHFIMAESDDSNPYEKWDDAWRKLTNAVKALHKSNMNVIVVAHAEKERHELTGERQIRPYFQGKRSHNELPKIFDIIGFIDIVDDETGDRVLRTKPSPDTTAKDRFDMFPAEVLNPTFEKLVGYMKEARKTEEKKVV